MLNLTKVYKTYPNNFQPTIKGIDFHLSPGEFCIIIGSNGSGKSTLMRIIAGETSIDSGKVTTNSSVTMVTQDINKGTIPEMTLLENIVLSELSNRNSGLKFYNQYKKNIIKELEGLNLNLEKYIDTPLSNLSGGQRQMIATLMAIHSKAEILLLDEHTSALDPKMQKIVMQYTDQAIKENGLASMMITHKLDDAINYGNRLIMLHNGQIVIDLNKEQKQAMTIEKLLDLFHQYEDLTFRGHDD